ncbi:DNA polymerase III subunit beta [Endozoicomonas montiporae]|uniref:DNA polymerase III subunit beta n=2 Tax=Endozoicomonas montiporae TaxID=1027273 RepID=A0A081NAK7_9GAMM|nr:DNA polymerase subunit beta [Endozoicomonas montiporae CL-33]KEQ15480.1 DNA polymerase III subunit beta [Endozoicomonas montiporae]
MRLTENELNAIRQVIYGLDPNAEIWLFGSRVDDQAKGGDIDLLIMSEILTFMDKSKIRIGLYDLIGEQKIDLVIAADDSDPFTRIALSEGVRL